MRRRVVYPSHEKVNENELSQFGNEPFVRERTDGIEESIFVVPTRLPDRETRQACGKDEVAFSRKGSGILVGHINLSGRVVREWLEGISERLHG